MDKQPTPTAWLIKSAAAAALLLLACGIATARFGHTLQLPVTTTRDGALVTMNRYVDNPVPDIVLVGSSMTVRLGEQYFKTPRVRNLALAGGSPITALDIIANQRQLPRLIVVETNILSRAPDAELVKRFSTREGHETLFLRPIRTAIAAYENRVHAPVTHAEIEARLKNLLEQPPSNFDNRVYLQRAIGEMESEDPGVAAKANVETLGHLIDALEQRGTRVLLMEMPYAPPIEASRYVRITREIVHRAFPDRSRWLPIDVDRSELRWDDGVHLDTRSAVLVSRYLDERFSSRLRDIR
ncbi:hypothetical protein I6F35_23245 [Bradyrhizobium sp. BRP22]|uniref:hypothetical protein n=1 Tax=Bradyrhizobium sp. BRP22 TaxID=2793821 RepID=UPI001CD54BE9|nr:hypothetical protein [Bradyrhizobium sp. BRP22]MCA1456086.1 hypothetical protein [Bradyrhizobium sp. BRP22]